MKKHMTFMTGILILCAETMAASSDDAPDDSVKSEATEEAGAVAGPGDGSSALYEGFSYKATPGTLLVEAADGGQGRWGSVWQDDKSQGGVWQAQGESLSYTRNGNTLRTSGGRISTLPGNQWPGARIVRQLDREYAAGVVWMSWLQRMDSPFWGELKVEALDPHGNTSMLLGMPLSEKLEFAAVLGETRMATGIRAEVGRTYFLAVKIDFDKKAVTMYLDPDPGAAEENLQPTVQSTAHTLLPINRLRITAYNTDQEMSLDEVRIGTTWDSVSPGL